MTTLALIRHGLTDWNKEQRLQGRLDLPLSPEGRAILARWHLPADMAGRRWYVSPLGRARETAALIGLGAATIEPLLVERSWGGWEGKCLADLQAQDGQAFADAEALGLDFRPPGGETQREVQHRLRPFLARIAAEGVPAGAVCHKGLITALMAAAVGWDMVGKPPIRLDWNSAHLFTIAPDGTPSLLRMNLPLLPPAEPASRSRRILIHVQHLLGTGHLIRAAQIARAFAAAGHDTTIASGGEPVTGLDLGRAHLVQLPPVRALDSSFKTLVGSAGRPYAELMPERRDRLQALVRAVDPEILIVEAYPFGRRAFRHEIDPLIATARAGSTRLVAASVRDVLVPKADPARNAEIEDKVADLFDLVLVHGDKDFLPLEASFPIRRIAAWLRYTGYVADPAPPPAAARAGVIVSAGGGAVGGPLLAAAIAARPLSLMHAAPWRLLAGPNLPREQLADLAAAAPPGVSVEANRPDFLALLAGAQVSVSQAGYNTVLDLLRTRTPAVLVPFAASGETEQPLRAAHLARHGLAHVVPESALTAAALAAAIDSAALAPPPAVAIALGGAARTVEILLAELSNRAEA